MNTPPTILSSDIMIIMMVIVFIIGVMILISAIAGWGKLAESFRGPSVAPSVGGLDRFTWMSARLRFRLRYNNSLTVLLSEEGIHIRAMLLIKLNHPPIFIPWSAIKGFTRYRLFFTTKAELEIKMPDHSTFKITFESWSESLALRIEERREVFRTSLIKSESRSSHQGGDADEALNYTLDQG